MAEMTSGGAPQQRQSPIPPIDELMKMYDPKQLMMLGQALTSILKAQAATQPRPDPRQQAMQPGAMEQLAMLDLMKRKREEAMRQQGAQGMGMPIPR